MNCFQIVFILGSLTAPGYEVLCLKIEREEIKDSHVYFIVSTNPQLQHYYNGVVVKRVTYRPEKGYFNCKSDNNDSSEPYLTFRLEEDEVLEVWCPKLKLSHDFSDLNRDVYEIIFEVQSELEDAVERIEHLEGRIEELLKQ